MTGGNVGNDRCEGWRREWQTETSGMTGVRFCGNDRGVGQVLVWLRATHGQADWLTVFDGWVRSGDGFDFRDRVQCHVRLL